MSTAISLEVRTARAARPAGIVNIYRPRRSIALMMVGDFVVLFAVLWTFTWIDTLIERHSAQVNLLHFYPVVPILVLTYWIFDAHPGMSLGQTEEFRRIAVANLLASLSILASLQIYRAPLHSRLAALGGCVALMLAVPLGRCLVRLLGANFPWWGHPVVILGDGEAALSVLRRLQRHPEMGIRPVAIASLRPEQSRIDGQPVHSFSQLHKLRLCGVRHAVIAAPELSRAEFAEVLERGRDAFPHIIVIPELDFFWKTGHQALDFHSPAGLSVQNNLLLPRARFAKRLIDIVVCLLTAAIALPVIVLISVLIFLDSGRPVFFSQRRLGLNGKTFKIWKFRTMVKNAEQLKQAYLRQHPGMLKEW